VSPLRQAAKVDVPVPLARGRLHRRVRIDHSLQFLAEARRAGVKVEWVEYSDDGHGFVNPANQADFLRKMETFLGRSSFVFPTG
jgi:dipeptidyl aminopeptidase/acylaminoacyl peptidase